MALDFYSRTLEALYLSGFTCRPLIAESIADTAGPRQSRNDLPRGRQKLALVDSILESIERIVGLGSSFTTSLERRVNRSGFVSGLEDLGSDERHFAERQKSATAGTDADDECEECCEARTSIPARQTM